MTEISVVMPVRNGGDSFRRTLVSLESQDLRDGSWEAIIVDDGSSQPVEHEFARELSAEFPKKILRLEGKGNRPRARNIGLEASSGSAILMMDADLEFDEDLVYAHLLHHRRKTADVIMGARVDAWQDTPSRFHKWADSRAMGGRPAGPFPWRYCITGNLSLQKALLESIGGSDENIVTYGGEDTELGYRFMRAGATFHWAPDIRVNHLNTITLERYVRRMFEYGKGNLRYLLEKHPGMGNLLGNQWALPLFARPRGTLTIVMRLVTRITLQPWLYRLVLRWMNRFGMPGFLFTYLSVGGCILGLQDRDFAQCTGLYA